MKFGLNVANFGEYFNPNIDATLALEAEKYGWDGFFLWDHILGFKDNSVPVNDPWIVLAAIAVKTRRIRFGALVTPIARRRPWKVARETISLDYLSNGRLIFGVGLGAPSFEDFEMFGEEKSAKVRAEKLDEGLEILTGLWSGKPFRYEGKHYNLHEMTFLPPPIQCPRIPVWIGGMWPNKNPFRRASEWDGVVPIKKDYSRIIPEEVSQICSYIQRFRTSSNRFDIVISGQTPLGDDSNGVEIVSPYSQVGVTWWLEEISEWRGSFKEMRERIRQGPPVEKSII